MRGYLKVYRLWERWCAENGTTPERANRDQVARWVSGRRQLSSSTIRNTLISLRAYYRAIAVAGLRHDDPTDRLKMPPVPLVPVIPYSPDDLRALLAACRSARDRALILVLLDSGLRRSEMAGITAAEIDWQAGTIFVHGKGGKARLVALGDKARLALSLYVNGHNGPVWGLNAAGLETWLRRLSARAGVEANLHRFRNTFACLFLEAGGCEGQLQKILGHSTLAMSHHYAENVRDRLALAAQRRFSPGDRLSS